MTFDEWQAQSNPTCERPIRPRDAWDACERAMREELERLRAIVANLTPSPNPGPNGWRIDYSVLRDVGDYIEPDENDGYPAMETIEDVLLAFHRRFIQAAEAAKEKK